MILYKYLTVEKADEWLIGEDSILLTPPIYLNDLLEFRIRREPATPEERREMFIEFQHDNPSSLSFEEFEREITKQEFLDTEAEAMRSMMSKGAGVISLTTNPADELMWAHYGLNRGIAVGYSCQDAMERDGIKGRVTPLGVAVEANYTNQVTPMRKDFSDAARQLSTKRECWRYEHEWRIFGKLADARQVKRDGKTFYCSPAMKEQIAHVVFGVNADQDFIDRTKRWLNGGSALVQKLSINRETHELELSDAP
jgi:hypothetical protein